MNIYDDEGELDLDKARAEAGKIEGARNETTARARAHELTIGALLDIAGSLRILAAESAIAMSEDREPTRWGIDDFDDDTTPARAATLAEHVSFGRSPLDWLDVGDLVHRADDDTAVAEVVKVGITEDEPFADLSTDPEEEGYAVRLFQRDLVLLRGDEAPHVSTDAEDAEMIDADDAPELFEGGEAIAEGLADEIDDDFEGDNHTATDDAIAVLKANEAARKAAKKSGSKKGSKA